MKPILLRIRKLTKVPTKHAIKHQWRSDWKLVGKIDYSQSIHVFKILGGPIEKDSQFAKLLFDNYGTGRYSVLAWRKGYPGMWSFVVMEIDSDGYKRLPKSKNTEQREMAKARHEINRLKRRSKDKEGDMLKDIQDEIDEIKDDYNINKEIEGLEKDRKRGPSPYLKAVMPIYKFHEFEEYNVESNVEEVEAGSLW